MALENFVGFDWDDGNKAKNWDTHQVTKLEAEEIFFNKPLLLYFDEKHSSAERRYFVLGITDTLRKLQIVFTKRNSNDPRSKLRGIKEKKEFQSARSKLRGIHHPTVNKIRIISARDMSRKERRTYEENTKI